MTILDELLIYIDDLQPIERSKIFAFFTHSQKSVVASALAKLYKRGDIIFELDKSIYRCTKQGGEKITQTLEELDNLRRRATRNWFLCFFAIPEKNKVSREKLRLLLHQYGFARLRGGLFIAHRRSLDYFSQLINREMLASWVNIIQINDLPDQYINRYAIKAWPWVELIHRYRSIVQEITELLSQKNLLTADRARILARLSVFKIAEVTRRDPDLDYLNPELANLKNEVRNLYLTIKPLCYR